jgi:hypothetical protein
MPRYHKCVPAPEDALLGARQMLARNGKKGEKGGGLGWSWWCISPFSGVRTRVVTEPMDWETCRADCTSSTNSSRKKEGNLDFRFSSQSIRHQVPKQVPLEHSQYQAYAASLKSSPTATLDTYPFHPFIDLLVILHFCLPFVVLVGAPPDIDPNQTNRN